MIILPAIDIIGGKVVRLSEGAYETAKNYSMTPIAAANDFYDRGARHLHVVDLDGAKSGNADNAETIEKILTQLDMFIEVGGGIRTVDQIKKYVDCGVSRVILGTAAVKDIKFVEDAVNKYGEKIAVGVDAKNNFVAINGWKEITDINSIDFCKRLQNIGVSNIIYTDIAKDGMLNGTNLDIYKVLCQTLSLKITASGGICSLNDIERLKEIGVYGAIIGKALYENRIDLESCLAALRN